MSAVPGSGFLIGSHTVSIACMSKSPALKSQYSAFFVAFVLGSVKPNPSRRFSKLGGVKIFWLADMIPGFSPTFFILIQGLRLFVLIQAFSVSVWFVGVQGLVRSDRT
jgi:hypothetical protein